MAEPEQPKTIADLLREAAERLSADVAEDLLADALPIPALKHVTYAQIPDELAMDMGLIPDTRPAPPPPTRWQRIRRAWRDWVQRTRWAVGVRVGSWIAGVDVGEGEGWS